MTSQTYSIILIWTFLLCLSTTEASESFTVGISVTQEQKNEGRGWPHLEKFYASSLATVEKAIIKNFSLIQRCRIVAHEASLDSRGQSQYIKGGRRLYRPLCASPRRQTVSQQNTVLLRSQ